MSIVLAREGIWVVGGRIGALLGSLLLVRILTDNLAPDQYGTLSLALTFSNLIVQCVMGGLIAAAARLYCLAQEQRQIAPFERAVRRWTIRGGQATFAILIVLGLTTVAADNLAFGRLLMIAVVVAFLSSIGTMIAGVLNSARLRASYAVYSLIDNFLKVALCFGLFVMVSDSLAGVLLAYGAASLASLGFVVWWYSKMLRMDHASHVELATVTETEAVWGSRVWEFAWPFTAWGVFSWLYQSSDRWALNFLSGEREVGLYTVAYQLGYTPLMALSGIAMTLVAPLVYQRFGDGGNAERVRSSQRLSWLTVMAGLITTFGAFLLAMWLHEDIFRIFAGEAYRSGSPLFSWMVLGGGLFATGQILAMKMFAELASRKMMRINIYSALLGALFNTAGAAVFGLIGLVGAIVLYSVLYLCGIMWITLRHELELSGVSR